MPTVRINHAPYEAHDGERLSALLARFGIAADHPCGGRGTCKKCTVTVNGRAELSCQYILCDGDVITLSPPEAIAAEGAPVGVSAFASLSASAGFPVTSAADPAVHPRVHPLPPAACDLVLDLGTTTLALAVVDRATGDILRVVTANNPQRACGADVMSRIDYACQNGLASLRVPLYAAINRLIAELQTSSTFDEKCPDFHDAFPTALENSPNFDDFDATIPHNDLAFDSLYVAGNTTMLHLLLGVDPTPMGTAPYTPVFLDERHICAADLGLTGVRAVIALPGIAAFVGADLVAGAYHVGRPPVGQYRLLVDLGTNAEILLIPGDPHAPILCTAAAAGPCFEGASISCGMSATPGAICAYESDGTYATIPAPDGTEISPRGLCGTGLVDAVAALLDTEVIDETGYMDNDIFYLTDTVSVTREDIRQYQLAKSAVCAAIESLLHIASVDWTAVDRLCIAGGFAAKLSVASAVRTGLLPAALADRCVPVGNAALFGTARYAASGHATALTAISDNARYIDLAADSYFSERFMEGMLFE